MGFDKAPAVFRFGGGLNLVDAPDMLVARGQTRQAENWRLTGQGWIGTRKGALELTSIASWTVVAIFPFNHAANVGAVLLEWNGTSAVRLATVDGSGANHTVVGNLPGYTTGVSSFPEIVGAVLGKCLFMCDTAATRGLVIYDPNDVLGSGATGGPYQPTFDFNQDSTFAVAKPRMICEHANHLWMFGFGDESAPDRGELARFSYLGLVDDGLGSGDAGTGGAAGSENLFDVDDFAPVGPVGSRVISAASAPGRLGIALENGFGVVYGTGRDNWQYDFPIDTERGSVAPRGMIQGDGVLWWYSPLGLARFRGGGQCEDLSRPADPVTEEIDFGSLFAVHYPQENQVRWYYRRRGDTTAGADRWLGFNYLEGGYEHDVLGYRVFCAGWLLPSGAEGPAAAPSALTHEAITRFSARAVWTPGDTAPGVLTRVYRAPDASGVAGTYTRVAELGPGAKEFTHTGLEQNTKYWTKIEHFRNNQVSASVEDDFTTLDAPVIPPPLNVQALDSPVLWDDGWTDSVLVTWDEGGLEPRRLHHAIERRINGGEWEVLNNGLPPGRLWWREYEVEVGSFYEYRVRAYDAEVDLFSAYGTIAAVTPQGLPYPGWPEG